MKYLVELKGKIQLTAARFRCPIPVKSNLDKNAPASAAVKYQVP